MTNVFFGASTDPEKWGYGTLEGMLDEDMVQALDQLISEALGVGRNPADRWRNAGDGMHVIAGALYGLLREDRWIDHGGSIETWLQQAALRGRLNSDTFHAVAARVLERRIDQLWPLSGSSRSVAASAILGLPSEPAQRDDVDEVTTWWITGTSPATNGRPELAPNRLGNR